MKQKIEIGNRVAVVKKCAPRAYQVPVGYVGTVVKVSSVLGTVIVEWDRPFAFVVGVNKTRCGIAADRLLVLMEGKETVPALPKRVGAWVPPEPEPAPRVPSDEERLLDAVAKCPSGARFTIRPTYTTGSRGEVDGKTAARMAALEMTRYKAALSGEDGNRQMEHAKARGVVNIVTALWGVRYVERNERGVLVRRRTWYRFDLLTGETSVLGYP